MTSKKYTNHLIKETSPYLLQHAHNPVEWYPWGEEALQKAIEEDKPILVSIGYAACHWCHVMERESFENESVAQLMNQYFINIKIDREERPDLDHIYMDAVQAISGAGGWPLNVFLTPDKKPFFGGTYYPPERASNRTSWTAIIQGIHQGWTERKSQIIDQANSLTEHLAKSNLFGNLKTTEEQVFTTSNAALLATTILQAADTKWGGFGKAPKFPQTFVIQYLLQHSFYTGDQSCLDQALLSIDKMLWGGIYDQVGGGLARYSTDNEWLVPHFEKMLYDNALFLNVLSEAYQVTGHSRYAHAIQQTMNFLKREMYQEGAGFYAALDADSEGEEGKFYIWNKQEIEDLLDADAAIFCDFFNIKDSGNLPTTEPSWEGKNILWKSMSEEDFVVNKQLTVEKLHSILNAGFTTLLAARNKRVRPLTDDKILLGWNALMLTAICKAYAATGTIEYKDLAIQLYNTVLTNFAVDEAKLALYHTYKDGQAKTAAFLDDYAYLIQACIHLQEITGEASFLLKAAALTEYVLQHFSDQEAGYFFYTGIDQKDVIVRKKEVYDGAVPSGNSIMTENLHYLSIVLDRSDWRKRATDDLKGLSAAILKYPSSFAIWAKSIEIQSNGYKEIVIIGKEAFQKQNELLKKYIPGKILQVSLEPNDHFPLLKNKGVVGNTWIYICKDYACSAPIANIEAALSVINKRV